MTGGDSGYGFNGVGKGEVGGSGGHCKDDVSNGSAAGVLNGSVEGGCFQLVAVAVGVQACRCDDDFRHRRDAAASRCGPGDVIDLGAVGTVRGVLTAGVPDVGKLDGVGTCRDGEGIVLPCASVSVSGIPSAGTLHTVADFVLLYAVNIETEETVVFSCRDF